MNLFLIFSYITVQHIVEKITLSYVLRLVTIEIQGQYAVCLWNAFDPRFCSNNMLASLSLLLLLNDYILKPTSVSPQIYFSQLF